MRTSLRWTHSNFSCQRRAESTGLNRLTATYFFPIPQIKNNEDSTPSTGARRRSVQDQRDPCRRREWRLGPISLFFGSSRVDFLSPPIAGESATSMRRPVSGRPSFFVFFHS